MSAVSASSLQRLGPIADLPGLLHGFGMEIRAILAGLDVREIDFRPDSYMPLSTISSILDRAVEISGSETIGLDLGRHHDHHVLGALGELMSCCDTLGNALGTFVNLQIANSTAAAAYIFPMGRDYAFGFGVYAPEVVSSQFYDVSAMVAYNMISALTNGTVVPREIMMSRPAPRQPDSFRRQFPCPVRFEESHSCLILTSSAMDCQLATADADRRAQITEQIQRKLMGRTLSVSDRVRHALRSMLFAGRPALSSVARHMGIHPRRLERELKQEKMTFEILREDVRMAVAQELLLRTSLTVSEVAIALGYGSPTVFGRAFRRRLGEVPSRWRRSN